MATWTRSRCLLVRSLRSLAFSTWRCSIPAICGFSKRPHGRPLASAGCTVGCSLCLSPSAGRFFPAPALGRWMGVRPQQVCAKTTER